MADEPPPMTIPGDFLPAQSLPKAPERRAEPRQQLALKLQASTLNALDQTDFEILCLELSGSGMSFRTLISFKTNETIAVRMPVRNGTSRLIRCRVAHCRPMAPGIYIIGVQFLEAVAQRSPQDPIPTSWLITPDLPLP